MTVFPTNAWAVFLDLPNQERRIWGLMLLALPSIAPMPFRSILAGLNRQRRSGGGRSFRLLCVVCRRHNMAVCCRDPDEIVASAIAFPSTAARSAFCLPVDDDEGDGLDLVTVSFRSLR